ncbi:SGNH/GDSL hydrolase family protein [Flavobacterium hiemivividum]|uniref:G-D-S-L family lipolytic protein n=1 Tax=Flavobacterium hiemivividum TaxID=2541734 RepID=A0A4R5D527_9FLAO|nr:G-D-S-L family lipolytic protein [Flavobacterium hiemivividum]TDE06681.1 G-D-S-L family lipolytic protein [Flavobacterium hiemivividum]
MIKNFKWLLLVSLSFVACNNDDAVVVDANSSDGLPLTAGTADFSKFVSLGNSLTAGYSDNALFIEGQKVSYTNIMAQQFAEVGGGTFKIPFMADNVGGFKINGTVMGFPRLASTGGVAPVAVVGTPSTEILTSIVSGGPYNNCGVPGAKSFHLLSPSYGSAAGLSLGTANPYYVRFAPNATTSVVAYAMSQTPTFFSLWIGNNDVLGYATTGGDGTNPITPSAGPAGAGFDATYDALVNTLTSGGAKGVVANIPYVNTVPFFTFIATNPVPLNATQVAQLNPLFGAMNSILAMASQPARFQTLTASSTNPLLIADEMLAYDATALFTTAFQGAPFNYPLATASFLGTLYGKARHASNAPATRDYILLTAGGSIGAAQPGYPANNSTIGITFPMEDKATLTASEVALVKTATDAYNAKIKAVATAKGLAFVDANALMTLVAGGGFSANGFSVTGAFITGGGFSTDGVHPSPRGYAMIANKFVEAINMTYGSNLKGVNLGDYRILFPKSL